MLKMILWFLVTCAFPAVFVLAPATAEAAPPQGSYLQTCSSVTQSGSIVTASCRNSSGLTYRTSIDNNSCIRLGEPIANIGGSLRCALVVYGTYAKSCYGYIAVNGVLTSDCKPPSGALVRSRISVLSCGRENIANINGQLTCAQ